MHHIAYFYLTVQNPLSSTPNTNDK